MVSEGGTPLFSSRIFTSLVPLVFRTDETWSILSLAVRKKAIRLFCIGIPLKLSAYAT